MGHPGFWGERAKCRSLRYGFASGRDDKLWVGLVGGLGGWGEGDFCGGEADEDRLQDYV